LGSGVAIEGEPVRLDSEVVDVGQPSPCAVPGAGLDDPPFAERVGADNFSDTPVVVPVDTGFVGDDVLGADDDVVVDVDVDGFDVDGFDVDGFDMVVVEVVCVVGVGVGGF
jgi:hypothetical protein